MFWSILHRTIFLELVKVFTLSLLGITGILVLGGIVPEASQQGLGPLQILGIIPLLIPSMMPYSIPATTLFTACVVYGRLSADNEILAVKAAGIHLLRVLWPGLLLGLLMSAATLALYHSVIPYTQHLLKTLFVNDVEDFLYAMLKKDREINQPGLNYVISVRQVQGRRLLDAVFFKRKDAKSDYDVIAKAREAELRVDMNRKEIHVHMRGMTGLTDSGESEVNITEKVFTVPLPSLETPRKPRARELSWDELLERRETVAEERQALVAMIRAAEAQRTQVPPPPQLEQHLKDLEHQKQQLDSESRSLATETHMRPVLSLGCLCFVLVGCPVGIWFSRSDYLSAFITCFLPIVFLYYPLLLAGGNIAKDGKLPPAPALWTANAVMGLIGLVLFRRLLRY